MPKIEIKIGESNIVADVTEQGSFTSAATDKPLLRIGVQFSSYGEQQKQTVLDFVTNKEPVTIRGNEKKFKIGKHSYNYRDGSESTTFNWELLELEELKLDKLVLNGWEIAPYKYKETFDSDGVLTSVFRVELSESGERQLRELPDYFPVIRKGINETPREMRFGQVLWSKSDAGNYRMEVYLVDKLYDELGRRIALGEPRANNVGRRAASTAIRLSALVDILQAKGVITSEEAENVRAVDQNELDRKMHEHDSVKDLDTWLDKFGGERI
jgi:hypothetical protein